MLRPLLGNYQGDPSNYKENCIKYRFCQQALSLVFIIISNKSCHSTIKLPIKIYIGFHCGNQRRDYFNKILASLTVHVLNSQICYMHMHKWFIYLFGIVCLHSLLCKVVPPRRWLNYHYSCPNRYYNVSISI
jgi:hypothetical protein